MDSPFTAYIFLTTANRTVWNRCIESCNIVFYSIKKPQDVEDSGKHPVHDSCFTARSKRGLSSLEGVSRAYQLAWMSASLFATATDSSRQKKRLWRAFGGLCRTRT